MARQDEIIVGLDVGTTKVAAVVGEARADGQIDIVTDFVVDNSDIPLADIKTLNDSDPLAPWQLYCFAVGASLNHKLHPVLQNVPLWKRWSRARHETLDNRLTHFKRDGGIAAGGTLNFKNKIWRFEWNGNSLKSLTHIKSGMKADCTAKHLTKDHDFQNFWSEADSQMKLGVYPAVKLTSLWKGLKPDAFGHIMAVNTVGAHTAIGKQIEALEKAYLTEVKTAETAAGAAAAGSRDLIKNMIKDQKTDKRRKSSQATRVKAVETVAARAKVRKVGA